MVRASRPQAPRAKRPRHMMTTMAALLGTLPIAMGFGAGAEARQPLGSCGRIAIFANPHLYVTPVFFVYLDQFQAFLRRKKDPARILLETAEAK